MEKKQDIKIVIIANKYLSIPDYKIFKIKSDKKNKLKKQKTEKQNKQKIYEHFIRHSQKTKLINKIEYEVAFYVDNDKLNYKNFFFYENIMGFNESFKVLWSFNINSKETLVLE